jgi:pyruvate dehydrogenase E2 component (dihydrolipoamide acetyltransferase)
MAEIVRMPKLGFDMAEGTLVRWVIQEGEPVAKGSILAEIETDKATVEVESNHQGIVAQHLVASGDVVPINTPIAVIAAPGEKVEPNDIQKLVEEKASIATQDLISQSTQLPDTQTPQTLPTYLLSEEKLPGHAKASPLARRIARDMRIDLTDVKGSGPGGRVLMQDVKAFVESPSRDTAESPKSIPPVSPGYSPVPPSSAPIPASERMPIPRLRAAVGRRMAEAKRQIPHFYVTHEYDMEWAMEIRKQFNAMLPEEERISVNDLIIKAVSLTLQQYPNLNASLQVDQIVHHGSINVGVAVAVEGGLLTVVCREANRKPLRQIANEVRSMSARARGGKVRPEDIEGSTFSVSNLGMFDVESFSAIINPPEAAILAVGSVREIPIIKDGQIKTGQRMKTTLSVDHRISDGAEAARFLQTLASYLEQPLRLVL